MRGAGDVSASRTMHGTDMDRSAGREQIDGYIDDLETMWAAFETLYARLSPADWATSYGKDWTFADQPYHLAFFDRVLVAEALEAGEDLPDAERWGMLSQRDIDRWNAAEFAKRPDDYPVELTLEEMRAARERIRAAVARHTDADLDSRKVFNHFFGGGFVPLRQGVVMAALHNWGELSELRHRLGVDGPMPPERVTHASVGMYLSVMAEFCRPERARRPFTIAWDLVGPGGGSWTTRVEDGRCAVREERVERADIRFRMTPHDFNIVMLRRAVSPPKAMFTGRMKVKGKRKLGTLAKLFPEPDKDTPILFSVG